MPEATITASIPVARANATIRLPFCFEDMVSPTALPYDSAEVPYKGHTPHRPTDIQRGWAAPRAAGPMGVGRPGRPMRAAVDPRLRSVVRPGRSFNPGAGRPCVTLPGPPGALWALALILWALVAAVTGEAVRVVASRWVPQWRSADPLERGILDVYLGGAFLYLVAALP